MKTKMPCVVRTVGAVAVAVVVFAMVAGCCTCAPKACGGREAKCGERPCPAAACGERKCPPRKCGGVEGNWSATLPYDKMYAGSLILSRDAAGKPQALVLHRWGSPEWCTDVKFEGNAFSFRHPYRVAFEGEVLGDRMFARLAPIDKKTGALKGAWQPFEGWRNPPVRAGARTDDAVFGEPVDILKDGLAGFAPMGADAAPTWSFKDGVLSNRIEKGPDGKPVKHGVNIMTTRADFYDFQLDYDVRVPPESNSGVYLRGRFEIQTLDSYGKPVDRHNMAAYYGRVTPSVAAEKPANEWQHVTVTLYKRHLTVVLNGTKIIDNAPVTGVTGGAIDADLFKAGPLYIQGDHSDADYRNMILRPAL